MQYCLPSGSVQLSLELSENLQFYRNSYYKVLQVEYTLILSVNSDVVNFRDI